MHLLVAIVFVLMLLAIFGGVYVSNLLWLLLLVALIVALVSLAR